ncbi:TnsA-like heteromeric transposase endonuclease subunit [Janibacter sp. DB-40]|uniref:TnsA-like heteromeric transposase endonuclease subunit n=1 Tax=Janibacter sp. DB-40 TaxID=3028808 RepID=UPI00240728DF|nr:TnsA-like heteromeric transposase endonuclease subunit [Janibacter sp. DB-40]
MPDSICGDAEDHPRSAVWSFDLGGGVVPWVGFGPPDARVLRSVRRIRSRSGAGHVPTLAYSTTTGAHLQLESGLEHDLVRDLDRDPNVAWLVAQPARIRGVGRHSNASGLVPDLLSVSAVGQVTVWAVRPEYRQDEKFVAQTKQTEAACAEFGWAHQVFAGMHPTRRSNLMWLDGFRRAMPWYSEALAHLSANGRRAVTLEDVLETDNGHGHVLSAVWHAIRLGAIDCDLNAAFTQETVLRFVEEGAS